MKVDIETLTTIRNALGNFLWLGNNLHNFFTQEFKDLFIVAVAEGRIAYDLVTKLMGENK